MAGVDARGLKGKRARKKVEKRAEEEQKRRTAWMGGRRTGRVYLHVRAATLRNCRSNLPPRPVTLTPGLPVLAHRQASVMVAKVPIFYHWYSSALDSRD